MTTAILRPKLVVSSADAAIAFYETAFGATPGIRYAVGDQVVFADFEVFGTTVQIKDEDAADPSPATLGRPGVLLDIETDDPDGLVAAVVDAGGEVVYPVADQPYGARGGRVRDPFGHEWLIQTAITLSAAEVQRRLDEMMS